MERGEGREERREDTKPIIALIGRIDLFWNYRYNYVRLRQAMTYLETATKMSEKHKLPFVLCGDFNLTPDSVC